MSCRRTLSARRSCCSNHSPQSLAIPVPRTRIPIAEGSLPGQTRECNIGSQDLSVCAKEFVHATAFLQPITWNRVSATSSLVIVEPSLEHDVHSRAASVDLVLVTSIRTLEHSLHLTHTRLLQSTLPPRGGDLKETKRPPTSLVRGSRGTDVARLQLKHRLLPGLSLCLEESSSYLGTSAPLGYCEQQGPSQSRHTRHPRIRQAASQSCLLVHACLTGIG